MNLSGSVKINKCGMLILLLVVLILFYYLCFARIFESNYGMIKNTNEINLRKLLIGSIQAAKNGGAEVLTISKTFELNSMQKKKTLEGAAELITDADRKSHCTMLQGLRRIFPKLNIISEEDESNVLCSDLYLFDLDPTVLFDSVSIPDEIVRTEDVTVWIDPLDATEEFSEKLFEYVTTMVCVTVKGQPTIGVIHNPFTLKTTWSWIGHAHSEDIGKIRHDSTLVKNPIIVISRSHTGNAEQEVREVFGENSNVIFAGGAGYKVLQIVSNNASAYIHTTNIKKWDICAGNAILNAIGGQMTTLQNEQIDYLNEKDVINTKGLIATLTNHNYYVEKVVQHEKKKNLLQ